jgi:hypothetical protein
MAWNGMPMGCASRRLAVLVATLLPAANLAAAPAANPAAAIATAAGHPAHRHLRAEASWSRDGRTGTSTLEIAGVARLERDCSARLCGGAWFDGLHGATFGINGTLFPLNAADDAAERTFAAIASTAFAEPEFLAGGGTVSALQNPGAAQLRYRIRAPQGAELIAVADARTLRLTAVESADRTPYRQLTASAAGGAIVYGRRAYDRIAPVDGPLSAPSGPAVSVSAEQELPLLRESLPIVPCSLSGRSATCLLDTGTTPSAVTLDFAERLDQEPYGQIEIAGLGTYLTGAVDAGPLVIGGASFGPLHFAVIPRARGPAFDVVLGSDVLAALRLTFETGRGRVRIGPAGDAADGAAIAVTFSGGLPFAQVRLGQRDGAEPMLVDTGDSEGISIGYDEYRDDAGLFAAHATSTAAGLGGQTRDALAGTLDRADVGGLPFENVSISAVRGQHIGHIGYGLVSRCTALAIELSRRRISCRRSPAEPARPGPREPER